MPINISFGNENLSIPTYSPDEFSRKLYIVKSCNGRKYIKAKRSWNIPISKKNLYLLSDVIDTDDFGRLEFATEQHNQILISKDFPTSLPLYKFQKQGASFIYHNLLNFGGALLADEPGLGKTLIALSVYERLKNEGKANSITISCYTKALKPEWSSHINKFTDFKLSIVEGSAKKRRKIYTSEEVTIMHHDLMRVDVDYIKPTDMLVIDETLKLKSYKNKTLKSFRQYAKNCKYIVLLSGSPIENNLQELYNIVNLVRPRFFGSFYKFAQEHIIYEKIYVGFNKYINSVVGYKNLPELSEKLHSIMIRRYKKDVAPELPPIISQKYYAKLDSEQRRIYNYITNSLIDDISEDLHNKLILAKFMFLRRVCDSPNMIKYSKSSLISQEFKDNIKSGYGGKFDVLQDILQLISIPNKVMIFTQWVDSCNLIYDWLISKNYNGILKVHGGIPDIDKQLDKFKTSPDYNILVADDLLSHGINLQACSNCIHFDIPFNPDKLVQRTSRFHRLIGTTRPVNSFMIYSRNTVEDDRLMEILNAKAYLFKKVLDKEGRSTLLQILKGVKT
tara:strand:+ start:202 stop:1887 length:1686 start_codon:yes stop_codon:yes gene_type:complete